jgi:hypothetical protein
MKTALALPIDQINKFCQHWQIIDSPSLVRSFVMTFLQTATSISPQSRKESMNYEITMEQVMEKFLAQKDYCHVTQD